jgi:hypothetical protein
MSNAIRDPIEFIETCKRSGATLEDAIQQIADETWEFGETRQKWLDAKELVHQAIKNLPDPNDWMPTVTNHLEQVVKLANSQSPPKSQGISPTTGLC